MRIYALVAMMAVALPAACAVAQQRPAAVWSSLSQRAAGASRAAGGFAAPPAAAAPAAPAAAGAGSPGGGMGMMMGMGMMGMGMGPGGGHAEYRNVWKALLDAHTAIDRSVNEVPGGVQTLTTSTDPKVAALIQRHVAQMRALLDACGRQPGGGCARPPVRAWDPLFAALFARAGELDLQVCMQGGVALVNVAYVPARSFSTVLPSARAPASQPHPRRRF